MFNRLPLQRILDILVALSSSNSLTTPSDHYISQSNNELQPKKQARLMYKSILSHDASIQRPQYYWFLTPQT